MICTSLHRLATWICLVATLWMGVAPAHGIVLCVGENGHVALEASTALASCFDCPEVSELEEGCCSDSSDGDSSCTCTDTLLLAGEKQSIRSMVSDRHERIPAPCVVVTTESDIASAPARGFDLRARMQPPPCPRVPTTLILRV